MRETFNLTFICSSPYLYELCKMLRAYTFQLYRNFCVAVSLAWGLRRVAEIILADITTG